MICGNFIKSETSEKLYFPISTFLVAISVEHLFFTDFYRKQDNSAVIFLHRVGKNNSSLFNYIVLARMTISANMGVHGLEWPWSGGGRIVQAWIQMAGPAS